MSSKYDLSSPAFFANPHPTFEKMRREDPIYFAPEQGMWFVTRYADNVAIIADNRLSSERVDSFGHGVSPELSDKMAVVHRFFANFLTNIDGSNHSRLRSLIAKAFTAKRVEALRGYTQGVVNETLDKIDGRTTFDVIADVGAIVPAAVISHILGVASGDFEQFKRWTSDVIPIAAFIGDPDENVVLAYNAIVGLEAYFRTLIEQRRNDAADDVLGVLVRAEEDGRVLSEQELVSTCAMLLLGGLETTSNMIGNALIALLEFPDQLELLRNDRTLMPTAVEEIMRFVSSAPALPRLALEDVELGGQTITAGQYVVGMINSANRDETVFDDPNRLDIRRNPNPHLGFGRGRHVCLGAMLARLEIETTLSTMLDRFAHIEQIEHDLDWHGGFAHRGVRALAVTVS